FLAAEVAAVRRLSEESAPEDRGGRGRVPVHCPAADIDSLKVIADCNLPGNKGLPAAAAICPGETPVESVQLVLRPEPIEDQNVGPCRNEVGAIRIGAREV